MPPSLPLHSILLPRRCIHVDDKRKSLLAGCGPYMERYDLAPSPALRSRLGVFTSHDEDVEGLVRVKGAPYLVAFSVARLALFHEDALKLGGFVPSDRISEALGDIRRVLDARFVKNELVVVVATSTALHRRTFAESLPLRCSFSEDLDSTSRRTVTLDIDDKTHLMSDMAGRKLFVINSNGRRFIHTLSDGADCEVIRTEQLPVPKEQRKGVLHLILALSEDAENAAIVNTDKTIEYIDTERAVGSTSLKRLTVPSRITSLAIAGEGKNAKIYYGTETGELSSLPLSFYYDVTSFWTMAGSSWGNIASGDGQGPTEDLRGKAVQGYGLVDPLTWLAADGRSTQFRRGAVAGLPEGSVSRESTGPLSHATKTFSFDAVSLVAVAVHKQYVCMQSKDGIMVVMDVLKGTSARYDVKRGLSVDRSKLGRTPLLKQICLVAVEGREQFVVGFDKGTLGVLSGIPADPSALMGKQLDSLFISGALGRIDKMNIDCEGADFVRMGRFGYEKECCVHALDSSGIFHRIDIEPGMRSLRMRLSETVDLERVLSLTPLPHGDLLVCGLRKGVLVGVSLCSLRILFSLAHLREHFTPSIKHCTVLFKDNKVRITLLAGQTLLVVEERWYGETALTVEKGLHSEKVIGHTSVFMGFGRNENKSSYESGHALITASSDGLVVVSSLWNNGRIVPMHRFRVPGVTCLTAFSHASRSCVPCAESASPCPHREATEIFRWASIIAGTKSGRLYTITLDFPSHSDQRVFDRPFAQSLQTNMQGMASVHISTSSSTNPRATVYVGIGESFGIIELSMLNVADGPGIVCDMPEDEKTSRIVREGLVVNGFGGDVAGSDPSYSVDAIMSAASSTLRSILGHPLIHPSARLVAGTGPTVIYNRLVYTAGSLRLRKGALIGTKTGHILVWGIVEETVSPEKRRMAVSIVRRGDPTRLPSEGAVVEEKHAKWGVIAQWSPRYNDLGEVVALSSTLAPSSAATTIAALFSSGKAAVFLLGLDKLVFMQFLETSVKDPVGISVSVQGIDNLNSRCSSPYPSSAVVSGETSIEVVRICQVELRKAIDKVWTTLILAEILADLERSREELAEAEKKLKELREKVDKEAVVDPSTIE